MKLTSSSGSNGKWWRYARLLSASAVEQLMSASATKNHLSKGALPRLNLPTALRADTRRWALRRSHRRRKGLARREETPIRGAGDRDREPVAAALVAAARERDFFSGHFNSIRTS